MGLLDAGNYLSDPSNAAQLGLISGLFQAGAPSRMPVSFGQALSSGFQGANQAQSAAMQRQAQQLDLQQKQLGVMGQARTQKLINDYLQQQGMAPTAPPSLLGQQPQVDQPQTSLLPQSQPQSGGLLGAAQSQQPQQPQQPVSQPVGQPMPASTQSNGGLPMDSLLQGMITGAVGGPTAEAAYYKNIAPTDFNKQLMQMGIDPTSPLGRQLQQNNIAKQNYIAPVNARPGSIIRDPNDPSKILAYNPHIPDTGQPIFNSNGQVTGVVPLPGAADVLAQSAKATAAGQAGYGAGVGGQQLPPGVPTTFGPTSKAAISAYGEGQSQQLAAMDKGWTALQDQNRTAQTTSSYLDQIAKLAPVAATGPGSDKKEFVNGLLSLVGDEKATDATTANNLLDKYQGQIIARLSTGGMGTDAARTLLASAYPGAHMNAQAIQEATQNLKGANEMVKAKASLLSPYAAKRDPISYQQNEVVFDQNADPNVFQYINMAGTKQGAQFYKQQVAIDPTFPQRIAKLHQIGAIQ